MDVGMSCMLVIYGLRSPPASLLRPMQILDGLLVTLQNEQITIRIVYTVNWESLLIKTKTLLSSTVCRQKHYLFKAMERGKCWGWTFRLSELCSMNS